MYRFKHKFDYSNIARCIMLRVEVHVYSGYEKELESSLKWQWGVNWLLVLLEMPMHTHFNTVILVILYIIHVINYL